MTRNTILKFIATVAVAALGVGYWTNSSAEAITEIPPIVDADGNIVPGGLALLEEVTLGGVDQWVLIRTQDVTNPVLLVLHGGPGGSQMPWVNLFQPAELEENFVVVHWDQRGAGKSFDADLSIDVSGISAYVSK